MKDFALYTYRMTYSTKNGSGSATLNAKDENEAQRRLFKTVPAAMTVNTIECLKEVKHGRN